MFLGSCHIRYGKETRSHFVYFENSKYIHIDFDSDYSLGYQVNLKNPKKALLKAKRIVKPFKRKYFITVEELIKAGFESNIPEELYKK